MKNRQWLMIGGIIIALMALPVVWYLGSPLFIDNTVDEAFPFEVPAAAAMAAMSEEEKMALEAEFMTAVPDEATLDALTEADRMAVETEVSAAAAVVMRDHTMADPMPDAAAEWTAVAAGIFTGADSLHQGAGTATIYQQGEQRVLRLEAFSVTNGPDLHVILAKDPMTDDYLDLGSLKGNIGSQNYDIPADVDLSQYQSVVIYCVPFHVVFATAPLAP